MKSVSTVNILLANTYSWIHELDTFLSSMITQGQCCLTFHQQLKQAEFFFSLQEQFPHCFSILHNKLLPIFAGLHLYLIIKSKNHL